MLPRGCCCPHLQMQRVTLTMASKCPKTSSDLLSKSVLAAGACAAAAQGKTRAACVLECVWQRGWLQPAWGSQSGSQTPACCRAKWSWRCQALRETKKLQSCEAGQAWVSKQRSCDHTPVSISGGKMSLLALLQPSATLQALWTSTLISTVVLTGIKVQFYLPESSTLKTRARNFVVRVVFLVQQKQFWCVWVTALHWLLTFSLKCLGKGCWAASLTCSSHEHPGYSKVGH